MVRSYFINEYKDIIYSQYIMSSESILKKNIDKINSFSDIYTVTKDFTNKEKGDLFEELTKYIFLYHHNYRSFTKNVWLFNDIPQSLLKKLNIPTKDQGIDLVILDKYGKYHAIQCKFRTNTDEIIPWTTVSTFYGLTFGIAVGFSRGFYVTNTFDITDNATKSKNVVPVYGDFFDNIPKSFFNELKSILLKTTAYKPTPIIPRDYQNTIINKTINHFSNNDRGYLSMICGSGKTLTSYFINDKMKNKLIIAVVPSLYLLSQFFNDWSKQMTLENKICYFILVGSDADVDEMKYENNGLIITTDSTQIENNISLITKKKTNNKIIIMTTYQSSDKVIDALKNLNVTPDICIFDEAHKTVGQKGKQFNLLLDDKIIKIKKRLFMTATPKIFSGDIDNEKILSMNDAKWYGEEICSYSASDAIKDGYLCDYQIVSIMTNDKYIENTINENKNLLQDKKLVKSQYVASAIMLLNAFKEKNCHHLVTYHNTIASSIKFKDLLDTISNTYKMKISILQIDGGHTMKQRTKIIKEFTESEYAILVSSKVLNEGINIPIIDAVAFIDYRSSTIDIIQCVGRVLRIHEKKKLAKVYIPVFIDEKEDINETKVLGNIIKILRSLNETDSNIQEYFKIESNNGSSGKFLLKGNYISAEKVGVEYDIGKWISNIKLVMWKNKKDKDNKDNEKCYYTCEHCDFKTIIKADYDRHMEAKKNLRNIGDCGKYDKKKNTYNKRKNDSYCKCILCNDIFPNTHAVIMHLNTCNGTAKSSEIKENDNYIHNAGPHELKKQSEILRKENEILQKQNELYQLQIKTFCNLLQSTLEDSNESIECDNPADYYEKL